MKVHFVLGLLRDRKQYQSISLSCLHTVTFSVPAEHAACSEGIVVCGFARGTNVIAESAVREWLPGPEDTSGILFEWTPIHGRFEKHEIIKAFFSQIASNMSTRIDYIEAAPRKQVGRPRLIDDGSSVQSGSSSNPSTNPLESSFQSSLPICSSSTLLQPQMQQTPQDDFATLSLREILHRNLVRTLETADVCVQRLGHEISILIEQASLLTCETTNSSDGAVAARLHREVLCIFALQDHILFICDSYRSNALKTKVISEIQNKHTPELIRLQAGLSAISVFHHSASIPSTNTIDPSIQSSLLDGPPSTLLQQQAQQSPLCESNIEIASAQDARSSVSIGSATSAPSFNHRITLLAELEAAQNVAAQAREKIEEAEKVAAEAEKVAA